jgi:hypothetical protein
MRLQIKGEVRRRTRLGFGPLTRERWRAEPFALYVTQGEGRTNALSGLWFECVESVRGWVLQGSLEGVSCLFGEILHDRPGEGFSFTMLSVAGIELRGTADPQAENPKGAFGDPSSASFR